MSAGLHHDIADGYAVSMSQSFTDDADQFGHLDAPIVFRPRPRLIRAEQRIPWRIGLLCLTLSRFNQNSATVGHLHTLSWAMRSHRSRESFLSVWDGRRLAGELLTRMDPNLPVTLNLAVVRGLAAVKAANQRIGLTQAGIDTAAQILNEPGLFVSETEFLTRLGRLSDSRMDQRLAAAGAHQ